MVVPSEGMESERRLRLRAIRDSDPAAHPTHTHKQNNRVQLIAHTHQKNNRVQRRCGSDVHHHHHHAARGDAVRGVVRRLCVRAGGGWLHLHRSRTCHDSRVVGRLHMCVLRCLGMLARTAGVNTFVSSLSLPFRFVFVLFRLSHAHRDEEHWYDPDPTYFGHVLDYLRYGPQPMRTGRLLDSVPQLFDVNGRESNSSHRREYDSLSFWVTNWLRCPGSCSTSVWNTQVNVLRSKLSTNTCAFCGERQYFLLVTAWLRYCPVPRALCRELQYFSLEYSGDIRKRVALCYWKCPVLR